MLIGGNQGPEGGGWSRRQAHTRLLFLSNTFSGRLPQAHKLGVDANSVGDWRFPPATQTLTVEAAPRVYLIWAKMRLVYRFYASCPGQKILPNLFAF